jgi:hypothetical protein
MLEGADNRINDNFEFDTTFQYAQYLMRKHIHNTIAPKEKAPSFHSSAKVNKLQVLKQEMENLIEERKLRLNNIEKIASQAAYLTAYMENDPTLHEIEAFHDKLTE